MKSDSGIKSLRELDGQKITTIGQTSIVQILANYASKNGFTFELVLASSGEEAFGALVNGDAKAFVYDVTILANYRAHATCPEDFEIVGEILAYEPASVFYRKDDPKFAYVVDEALLKLIKTGLMETLWKKWFQSAIPPDNINLDLPPSAYTQVAWEISNKLCSEVYPIYELEL